MYLHCSYLLSNLHHMNRCQAPHRCRAHNPMYTQLEDLQSIYDNKNTWMCEYEKKQTDGRTHKETNKEIGVHCEGITINVITYF